MTKKVPFLGEERIARANHDLEAEEKKNSGRVIDEVLSTTTSPSSWEDVVIVRATNSIALPVNAHTQSTVIKPAKREVVPIVPGAMFKQMALDTNMKATIDWMPINNGHTMRINVIGNMDKGIREAWRKLLAETVDNGVGQFEFNFTQAPTISLTGLGMLLLFKEQKGSERTDIKLCHCNKETWQLLQWTGMDKYFVIQEEPVFDKKSK